MINFILILFAFVSLQSVAQVPAAVSAVRPANQDWKQTLSLKKLRLTANSALSVSAANGKWSSVEAIPKWSLTFLELNNLNKTVRDIRPYKNPNSRKYLRQAPWLYPLDGCYAKAAHVSDVIQDAGYVAPGKIFAFGNLRVKSKYAESGYAHWSYHVVPGYQFENEVYVIDPLVGENEDGTNSGLLTLQDWLARISSNPDNVEVSLCDSNAYDPRSKCVGGSNYGSYLGHMSYILNDEYENLQNLGFSADQLLSP